jgi:hypothetical protein
MRISKNEANALQNISMSISKGFSIRISKGIGKGMRKSTIIILLVIAS